MLNTGAVGGFGELELTAVGGRRLNSSALENDTWTRGDSLMEKKEDQGHDNLVYRSRPLRG